MGKILKLEEKKRGDGYSESYEVKFWIQEGEFWKQKTEMYFAKNKGEGGYVVDRWKEDYRGQNVKFVSVSYQ